MSGAETILAEPREPSRLRRWVAHAGVLVALAILLALGTWQVERLHWKQGIIDTIEARLGAAPMPIAAIARVAAETGDVDYRPAVAAGRFLNAEERFFLSTHEGQAGWNVYVPMVLDEGQGILFVNRGFVPYERKDPATRREGQGEGSTEVRGLARNERPSQSGWFVPENDPGKNVFFWADLDDLSAGLDPADRQRVLPFLLDAGPGAAPGGWPVGGTTIVDVPNNHLQYAITWYGLALTLAVMYGGFLVKRWRRPATP